MGRVWKTLPGALPTSAVFHALHFYWPSYYVVKFIGYKKRKKKRYVSGRFMGLVTNRTMVAGLNCT